MKIILLSNIFFAIKKYEIAIYISKNSEKEFPEFKKFPFLKLLSTRAKKGILADANIPFNAWNAYYS